MADYLTKTAEVEAHFKQLGENCVFEGKTSAEIHELVQSRVANNTVFLSLPVFRRVAVLNYIEGVQAGIARLCGEEVKEKFSVKTKLRTPVKKIDVPRAITKLQPDAQWHRHKNGGGWVSSTAYVEASAFVGAKAAVFENARVLERARVYGASRVSGNAECSGAAHIHGFAVVTGDAHVFDAAKVLGRARVQGASRVGGTSVIRGQAIIEDQEIYDDRVGAAQEDAEECAAG